MTRRLAVIPARGGSKRVPNKNIRDFCGKPMMAHAIHTARESSLFDVIHVSTEDADVTAVAADCGVMPDFLRPADLADDTTPLFPVLRYVAAEYLKRGRTFDQVWLVMPCAPLLAVADFETMGQRLQGLGPHQAVLTVVAHNGLLERAFEMSDTGVLLPLDRAALNIRTQDLPVYYSDAGVCAAFPAAELLSCQDPLWSGEFVGLPLPRHAAVDIDTEEDWQFAEIIYRGLHSDCKVSAG